MKKLIVTSTALKTAMKIAMKAVNKSSVLPILESFKMNVKIQNGKASLTVTSTDLENYIGVTIPCEAKEQFSFLIHSEQLKLIEKLDEQPVVLSVDEKTSCAQISTDDETISVACDKIEDYPIVPSAPTKKIGYMASDFINELKTSLNYVSRDDLRPQFTGVNFKVENGGVILCATDCHILRTTTLQCEANSESDGETFIMNPRMCKFLSAVKKVDGIHIAVMRNDTATYTVANYQQEKYIAVEIISRNIEARYCDYQSVIPVKHSTELTVNKNDLARRIDKAVLYCNPITLMGKFFLNGVAKLSASDIDLGKEYKTEFPSFTKTGDDIEIGFNLLLLKKVLSDLKGENVSLQLSGSNKVAVIKEVNSLVLLMPVLI